MKKIYLLSFLIRIGLMLYGAWQDSNMVVKFTDVDYYVFTDAAEFVVKGETPYNRATYRYTPLLAWFLTLNIWISPLIGKLIFIIFDVMTGHIIYSLIRHYGSGHSTARNSSLFWLFNPLSATVSSRGNAESVMAFLVLTSLSLFVQGKTQWSAVMYGLSVHFKIYPITFALPIYLYLGNNHVCNIAESQERKKSNLKVLVQNLMPNKDRVLFFFTVATVLSVLTSLFYWMYGWTFLYETYIYHIVRGDIKHNFSPYFYLLYLTSDPTQGVPLCLRLLVFLPQVILLLSVSVKFYRDLPLCWFLCTFVFVMANKVCTSQYFLWYLSLLPIILPSLHLSARKYFCLAFLWFFGQVVWLIPAYFLEFEGYNTFLYIWLAGLIFYSINAGFVYAIITHYYNPKKNKLHN